MKKEDLLNLINDDDLGLLQVKAKSSTAVSADERLVASFLEINNFIEENDREPELGSGLQEHQLASRLKAIREDSSKRDFLQDYDAYNLLEGDVHVVKTLGDVWEDDDLGILNNTEESLFTLTNVPTHKARNSAEYIERRKPCKNFDQYEGLFLECQADLASGKRKLVKFTTEKQVKERSFFVLNGVLLYVDQIGQTYVNRFGKINGRQRCIFENGTESQMLFRSLVQRLYENGHAVTERGDVVEAEFFKSFEGISDQDKKTGYIYVAKSLSENQKIKSLENLYKIGFSTLPVELRVEKAHEDPTFLMAPVRIITVFECFNLDPQKLEQMLHNFFGKSCLNIDIFDGDNKRYVPREWFIAPLDVIEQAVSLIISGGIVNYRYEPVTQKILLR